MPSHAPSWPATILKMLAVAALTLWAVVESARAVELDLSMGTTFYTYSDEFQTLESGSLVGNVELRQRFEILGQSVYGYVRHTSNMTRFDTGLQQIGVGITFGK